MQLTGFDKRKEKDKRNESENIGCHMHSYRNYKFYWYLFVEYTTNEEDSDGREGICVTGRMGCE